MVERGLPEHVGAQGIGEGRAEGAAALQEALEHTGPARIEPRAEEAVELQRLVENPAAILLEPP